MRKRWKHNSEQHVRLNYEMLESEAWKSLSCQSTWLFTELKHRCNGHNDRHLILPYKQIKFKLKSYLTIHRKFKELIKAGFIDKVFQGGLENNPSIYGLSDRWKGYGKSKDIAVGSPLIKSPPPTI